METTSRNNSEQPKEKTKFGQFFSNIFGGEILVKEKMRPWYFYFVFVLILVSSLVLSEQRIKGKQKKMKERIL